MEGWIKIHRNFLEWEWFDDSNTLKLFLYCILRANHEDKKWKGIIIKRGTFITSYDHLSKDLCLSVKQIRTSLSKLKRTGEMASESNNQHTVIEVIKYNDYQVGASKRDNEGQARGKRGATNKNEKNKKKYNSDKKKFQPPTLEEVQNYFREKGYKNAEKAFEYYDAAGWVDSNGNKIKNWKQKMIGVWFREENRIDPVINFPEETLEERAKRLNDELYK